MFKFYKALSFRANKVDGHEILALLKKLIYEKKKTEYFPNATIDFFVSTNLINVNKLKIILFLM